MEYEFNQKNSYMLTDKDFINIGLYGVLFTDDDLFFYTADVLFHEHIHHAILKVVGEDACIRFDFIAEDMRKFLSPHIADIQKRNGLDERTKEGIRVYYNL